MTKQLCIFSLFRGEHTPIQGFFALKKKKCSVTEINSTKISFQALYSNVMTLVHLQGAGEALQVQPASPTSTVFHADLPKD